MATTSTPPYQDTGVIEESLLQQLATWIGADLDAVVRFKSRPEIAIEARFGSTERLRRGLCMMRYYGGSVRRFATNREPVVVENALEVMVALPVSKDTYDEAVARYNVLYDRVRYEVFHEANVQAETPEVWSYVQTVGYQGDRDVDLGPHLIAFAMLFTVVPMR